MLNIDMKANICCVKYNPGSSNYIAVYTSTPPPTLQLTFYSLFNIDLRLMISMTLSHVCTSNFDLDI